MVTFTRQCTKTNQLTVGRNGGNVLCIRFLQHYEYELLIVIQYQLLKQGTGKSAYVCFWMVKLKLYSSLIMENDLLKFWAERTKGSWSESPICCVWSVIIFGNYLSKERGWNKSLIFIIIFEIAHPLQHTFSMFCV